MCRFALALSDFFWKCSPLIACFLPIPATASASQAGDKAGANAAIKALIKDTKLTKYVDNGVVSGSKFVDAVGLPSGEAQSAITTFK